jgi:hypothetical protein
MRIKPKQPRKPGPTKERPTVTVHVTIKNTPPDAARLAAQQEAMEIILAALNRR